MEFRTATRINAPAETIWALLTDAPRYPEWNPTVTKIEGRIAPGEKIKVFATISPDRAFPATVTVFEPNRRMVWSSGMPLGLFKGERTFILAEQPDGSVEIAMREVFSGLLAPLITRSIPDLQPSFDAFAAALKAAAESEHSLDS